jgi:hypothetical protein
VSKLLLFIVTAVLMIVIICGSIACKTSGDVGNTLNQVQQSTRDEMEQLDRDMGEVAGKLSGKDLAGEQTRSALAGLLQNRPYVVDVCTIDRTGRMIAVEPATYREFEGSDISGQEQVIRLFRTQQPVLSLNFKTVEGFEAADMEYPIFSSDKEITGAISVLVKPEMVLGQIIVPAVIEKPFTIWAMQSDGRILYDADPQEIGRNLFLDPLYLPFPQLISLGREMSAKKTGTGGYEFFDTGMQKIVKKEARWVTCDLYGTGWILVSIRVIS